MQELTKYRSDFFGKLREILGNRPDMRIVGDRFVLQSEVFFDTGKADLKPDGDAELDKVASALIELEKQIPADIAWVLRVDGHTDVRPITGGQFKSNWDLSAARAIAVVQYLIAKGVAPQRLVAAGFGEFQPIDTGTTEDAYRAQPPHRVQADRAVSAEFHPAPLLRRRRGRGDRAVAAHLAAALSADRFQRARRLVARALAQRAGAGSAHRGRGNRRRARSASSPSIPRRCISIRSWWRPSIGAQRVALTLLDEAKRISPRGLELLVNKDNARAIRFYEKHGFVYAGEDKNPVSGKPVNRMAWRPREAAAGA